MRAGSESRAEMWLTLVGLSAHAQAPVVPPEAVEQFQQVVGNRAETAIILGGDYGATGGIYSFRGGKVAELSVSKLGGGGNIASPRPLGWGEIEWAPVLQGNLGHFTADNDFPGGYLQGNRLVYDVLAAQGGAGARFYLTEHFSLAPTISSLYARTENAFMAQNARGDMVKAAASGTFVDWTIESWSVQPAFDLGYEWHWDRAIFEFSSHYNYFHTESFHSTSPVASVNGNSQTWENKLDADVPLGWKVFGRELHTGGFIARTELFGGIAAGLNGNHFYTVNSRFVLDLLGHLWKVRWLGVGASYFLGDKFSGWSAGLDLRFQF